MVRVAGGRTDLGIIEKTSLEDWFFSLTLTTNNHKTNSSCSPINQIGAIRTMFEHLFVVVRRGIEPLLPG